MPGDVIDISPWIDDRRPRRQVAQDLADREGISVAQAMLLLCVAGHEAERGARSRRRAPRRLSAARPEPIEPTEPSPSRRAAAVLDQLGSVSDGGRIEHTAEGGTRLTWEPTRGVVITALFERGKPGTVRAHHPSAGDTHWDLDERGIEYLRVALRSLVSS
ncbi:MAG: hypothetical protein ACKO91_17940 [Acidimicrobiales bacterium]